MVVGVAPPVFVDVVAPVVVDVVPPVVVGLAPPVVVGVAPPVVVGVAPPVQVLRHRGGCWSTGGAGTTVGPCFLLPQVAFALYCLSHQLTLPIPRPAYFRCGSTSFSPPRLCYKHCRRSLCDKYVYQFVTRLLWSHPVFTL